MGKEKFVREITNLEVTLPAGCHCKKPLCLGNSRTAEQQGTGERVVQRFEDLGGKLDSSRESWLQRTETEARRLETYTPCLPPVLKATLYWNTDIQPSPLLSMPPLVLQWPSYSVGTET